MCSWSPLELASTWLFLEIMSVCCWDAPLEVLLGTYLSAANKKCMAWVILYSAVTRGCVRYACKYSAVSEIRSDLVLLSIAWMKRYWWSAGPALNPSHPLWSQDFRLFDVVWMIILNPDSVLDSYEEQEF